MTQPETISGADRVSADTARAIGALTLYFHDSETEVLPRTPDYRTLPVYEGFDMAAIYSQLASMYPERRTYYQMDFQGVLKPEYDVATTTEVDEATLAVARGSDAFCVYITGEPDEYGRTKSTCIWTSRQEARVALSNPDHDRAVAMDIYAVPPVLTHYAVTLLDSGEPVYEVMTEDWAA